LGWIQSMMPTGGATSGGSIGGLFNRA